MHNLHLFYMRCYLGMVLYKLTKASFDTPFEMIKMERKVSLIGNVLLIKRSFNQFIMVS